MALPTPKELIALAKACRKAGISSFKGDGIEFALAPVVKTAKPSKSDAAKAKDVSQDPIETSEPTESEFLFWSVSDKPEEAAN